MFSRLSTVFTYTIAAFAVLAAAHHKPATTTVTVTQSPSPTPVPASQCNTGPVQCCNSVQSSTKADDPTVVALADDLGIAITGVDGLVGINCTPITVVGAGSGAQCNSQPVCCENNSFNGLIAIGCVIVNINA